MITIFKKRNLNFPSLTLKTSHERGLPGKCANQEFLRILLGPACAKSKKLLVGFSGSLFGFTFLGEQKGETAGRLIRCHITYCDFKLLKLAMTVQTMGEKRLRLFSVFLSGRRAMAI